MKALFFIISLLILLCPLCIYAEDIDLPEEYGDFADAIPEDVASLLPEGFLSGDFAELSGAVNEASAPGFLLGTAWRLLCGGLGSAAGTFGILVGIMILSALLHTVAEGSVGNLKKGIAFAIGVSTSAAVVGLQLPRIVAAGEFFGRLAVLMNSLIPIMGVLYVSGGNTMGAAVSSASLLLQINLIELGTTALVIPAVSVCMALTLSDALRTTSPNFSGITASIKRTLAFVYGLCSTLLMASLSAQSVLASAGDSAGARAVKFVAGNMIPVVGGTVGETLRTLAASVKLLRGSVGVAGMIAVALVLLPTLIELFLTRFVFNMSAAIGDLIGCKTEAGLYREIASLYGYIIAAAAMASLLCIFSLTIFAVGGVAIGGSMG